MKEPRAGTRKVNGKLLRELREARGWHVRDLSEKSGYSERNIERMEAGEASKLETIKDVAQALGDGVSFESLLDGYEPPAVQQRGLVSPPHASAALSTQPIRGIKIWLSDSSTYTLDTPREVIAYLLGQSIDAQQKIVVLEITKGSVIVELEMSEDDLLRLVAAFAKTRLDAIHVEAIHVPATTGPLAAGLLQIIHPTDLPAEAAANLATPELTLTRTPAKSLPFAVDQDKALVEAIEKALEAASNDPAFRQAIEKAIQEGVEETLREAREKFQKEADRSARAYEKSKHLKTLIISLAITTLNTLIVGLLLFMYFGTHTVRNHPENIQEFQRLLFIACMSLIGMVGWCILVYKHLRTFYTKDDE